MIPDPSDPRWKRVLVSDGDISRASLATRILLTRLRGDIKRSPASLPSKIEELRAFLAKNSFAQPDAALF